TGTNASNTAYADNLAVSPVTGTLASNYNVVYNNGGLTIGKANLTVNGVNTNVNYNGSAQTNSAASILGIQGTTDAFTISGYGTGTNASTTAYADHLALTATSGTLDNYNVTYNNGGLTIGKATLTVNGVNTNVTYNGSAQTNSAASIVGRQGSDDFTISG
ncbi:hypothetical protein G6649_09695, partial [Polynucleobacter paneuropaeus]|nr:hypothetical protein [Polynucleobacter paneuropaeus]MBT8626792.1 hypothetical protein [Polynucleobacter paneuropaeus]